MAGSGQSNPLGGRRPDLRQLNENDVAERVRVDVREPQHNGRREHEDGDVPRLVRVRACAGDEHRKGDDRPIDEAA